MKALTRFRIIPITVRFTGLAAWRATPFLSGGRRLSQIFRKVRQRRPDYHRRFVEQEGRRQSLRLLTTRAGVGGLSTRVRVPGEMPELGSPGSVSRGGKGRPARRPDRCLLPLKPGDLDHDRAGL
jgi:hypothetical protein